MSTVERILIEKIEALEKELAAQKVILKKAADDIWCAATVMQANGLGVAKDYFTLARGYGA